MTEPSGSEPNTTAAIYARVSTQEQVEGTSLDHQVDRCLDHIEARGWTLLEKFIDEGVSGGQSNRPALNRLTRLVEDAQVDVVVITKLDRIARSLRHLLDLLSLFEEHNVSLVALDDPLDPSTSSGMAMVQLRGVFAEFERRLIVERATEGKRRLAQLGGWTGGPPPYGFTLAPNPQGKGNVLAVDDEEARVVRLMYRMIAQEGKSPEEVAQALNHMGSRPRRSPKWRGQNVRLVLKEGRGLSGQWPYRRRGRPEQHGEDEILVDVPPILTVDEHEQLKAALALRTTTPSAKRLYPLRKRIASPHGAIMQGVPGQTGKRWYRCSTAFPDSARAPNTERCDCRRVPAAELEDTVWGEVLSILETTAPEQLAAEYDAQRNRHANTERDRLATVENEIRQLEARIGDEYASFLDEGFAPQVARAALRKRNDAMTALQKERASLIRFRQKNMAAQGLADRLRALSEKARTNLREADDVTRHKVFALLDLQVAILGWESCQTCDGKGYIGIYGDLAKRLGFPALACPGCNRQKVTAQVRVKGQIPELLVRALAEEGEPLKLHQPDPQDGVVLSFETETVRIA